jgi:hypothetical protein
MIKLTHGQLSFTTGDDERAQFVGEIEPTSVVMYSTIEASPIHPGTYRVIDGELFQVLDDLPDDEK